ncbi:inversin-like isoform X2 [Ischnura elegans]|uniref:inversin-like isoform X2 n=1 Tax=Ischnura elegans TaxID=197161 RepID=UPI001ED89D24|nr:inversin-like isoform X2 [Ischnura elegans]
MDEISQNCNLGLQRKHLRKNRLVTSPRKVLFSPVRCRHLSSPQEIRLRVKDNSVDKNTHPIFPLKTPSPTREACQFHAAAINGNHINLHVAISNGGLRWLEYRDRLGRTPLIYAILGNRPKCVMVLLKAGASPNSVDCHERNAFHWAALRDSFKCFKIMYKHEIANDKTLVQSSEEGILCGWRMKDKDGATALHLSTCASTTDCCRYIIDNAIPSDINAQDNNKRTPLHWASAAGNAEGVKLLLKCNARVDVMDESDKSPLFFASSSLNSNADECLKLLLEKSKSPLNWKDGDGRSALHLAVAEQQDGAEIVKILIAYDDFQAVTDKERRTPMHWAAMLDKRQTLIMLLDRFPDMLPCKDDYGATALHYAALLNYSETVQLLIAHNRFILEVEDANGQTPLLWAVHNNSCQVIQKLAKAGADLDHHDRAGNSVHLAVMQDSIECIKILQQNGANVNCVNNVGNTPFASACENGRLDMITVLAENGATVDTKNTYGRKPIHLVAFCGHILIFEYLIKLGIDVNCEDVQGITPLHIACYTGHQDSVSLLLETGAQLNLQDSIGWTPLHYAVSGNNYDVTQYLLDHSADPNMRSKDGKTVLDICFSAGSTTLVNLLEKFGAVTSN